MLTQKNVLTVNGEKRIYQLICDIDSPLGEIHDALVQFKAFIVQHINENEQREKASRCPSACKENPTPEVTNVDPEHI